MEGFEAMLGRMGGKGLFKVGEEEAFKDFSSRTKERDRAVGGGEVRRSKYATTKNLILMNDKHYSYCFIQTFVFFIIFFYKNSHKINIK